MDRKLKNTIILLVIFIVLLIGGGVFSFVFQKGQIEERTKKIAELNLSAYDTDDLLFQLNSLKKRVAELDSILALRKYNIPALLDQSRFYDFINQVTFSFSNESYVNVEYENLVTEENYSFYAFKLSGNATFNEFFSLVYAIEQSKELKKVMRCSIDNMVQVDKDGTPVYKVNFTMLAAVYFSDSDRFTTSKFKENPLTPNPLYDIFYPLIRNEIPPNADNLLDVQSAQLLALIPDGAFLADSKGGTYLLWEGDQVYLGYLTEIDYKLNEVRFILNKGGIIERVTLQLEKEKTKSE